MINRSHRFHGYNALSYVYRQGRTVRQPLCSLRYVPNPKRKTYRMAVVVSKKQHKSAVVRNRIRRRIYEVGRELIADTATYDLVFTVTSDEIATIPQKLLNKTILQLLQTSGVGKSSGVPAA